MGWKTGELLDVSAVGLFVTHTGALQVGSVLEVSFTVGTDRFTGSLTVASCNVVGLGGEGHATTYGTRLTFTCVPDESMMLIERLLAVAPSSNMP